MSGLASCLDPGEVRIWHARTDDVWASAEASATALAWLVPAERARYARFRQPADRAMFLLGHFMARILVGRALNVAPTDWTWRETERGRPEIATPRSGVSFNIAHSVGLVVCALSCDGAVGVDVESRRRSVRDAGIVKRYCSPAEAADINARGASGWHDQFLKYWTLKEAYLKATGLGLSVHLADLDFRLADTGIELKFLDSLEGSDPDWSFQLSSVGADHYLATAVHTSGPPPRFEAAPLPAAWIPLAPAS
ncbi:MAG: 4'-phosphopantetheinyl transferase superfamily protein [Vicinamibacterales bacterium]